MNETNTKYILDELPVEVRDILTQYAVQQDEDINVLLKKWIISAAERLTVNDSPNSSPREKQEDAA